MSRETLSEIAQQHTMDLVTKMGDDQKQELRDILSEGLREGKSSHEICRDMEEKIDEMSRTRAQAIARTETTRATNLGNWYKYKEKGFESFTVDYTGEACDLCVELYENIVFPIDAVEMLPPEPTHPHCMCIAIFHPETPEEYAEKYGYDVYDGGAGGEELTSEEDQQIEELIQQQDEELQNIVDTIKDYSTDDLTGLITTAAPEVVGSTETLVIDDLMEGVSQYLRNPTLFIQQWPARATTIQALLKEIGLLF